MGTGSSRTVVILVTSFLNRGLPEPAIGGRSRIVRDVARHLVRRGYQVRILQKGPRAAETSLEAGILVESVPVPMPIWADILFALKTRRAVRQAAVCCYATPEDGFPFFSKRGFAIQHGVWWDGPDPAAKSLLVRSVQALRNRFMCSRLRFVLCVDTNFSNLLRLQGREGHRLARKCIYSPNYADLERFPAPSGQQLENRFRTRKLLFLRRMAAPRGAFLFVEMCRHLQDEGVDFYAEMAGRGPLKVEVQRLIETNGLARRVALTEVPIDEAPEAIDSSSVSIVPSLWSEGTSLSAIESLVMGVPVVATDVGALASVIVPEFNGLVGSADPRSLADATQRLLADKALYLSLARNALSMREAFSFARWTRTLDDALASAGLLEVPEG